MGGVAVALIALVAVMVVFGGLYFGGVFEGIGNGSGGSGGSASGCGDSTASISYAVKNEYSKSSDVTGPTVYGRVDGGAVQNLSALTSLGVGAKISDIFVSASNYIDAKQDGFTVECGQTTAPVMYLKATADPSTFIVKNDGGTTLSDLACVGGTANASSTAGTLELEMRIGASSDQTTGDLIVVVEYDNSTQADKISIENYPSVTVPDVYTQEATASLVRAFRIPAVSDGATEGFTVKIEPESGQTLGAVANAIRFQYYSEQAFQDVDGSVKVGVEDSDGTLKYEDEGDYDVCVA